MEEWKDIPGFEGMYQASNLGRVKSLKNGRSRILVPTLSSKSNDKYMRTGLIKDGKRTHKKVHLLIALAFLNHVASHQVHVDHIDGDHLNNNLDNLQILSARDHRMKHIDDSRVKRPGSSRYVGVSWYPQTGKWSAKIRIDGKKKHLGYFDTELEASKAYQDKLIEVKQG